MQGFKKSIKYLILVFIASFIIPTMAFAETWAISYGSAPNYYWWGQIVKQSGQAPGPEYFYGTVTNGPTTENVNAKTYIINDFVSMQLTFQDANNCTVSAQKNGQHVSGTMVCNNGGGNIPFNAIISDAGKITPKAH